MDVSNNRTGRKVGKCDQDFEDDFINRMALDMLLLKEHGVCGYLKDSHTFQCDFKMWSMMDLLEKIEENTQKLQQDIQETSDR